MSRWLLLVALLFAFPAWAQVPTFVGVGTYSGSGTPPSPTVHASTLTDDILIATVEAAGGTATCTGGTDTWTSIANTAVGGNVELTVFWSRASIATPTPCTFNDTGNHTSVSISTWRGVITSEGPITLCQASDAADDTTFVSCNPNDTVVDETLVLVLVALDDPDTSTSSVWSGIANGDLSTVTERQEECHAAGHGGCVMVASGEDVTAGSVGTFAATLNSNSKKSFAVVGLKPPGAAATAQAIVISEVSQ